MRIVLRFGDTSITGLLNASETSRAFAGRLPLSLHMSGSGIDLCGKLPFDLPVDAALVHRGWANGDINYCPGGGWLAVLFGDEENSRRYGDQVTLGHVECPLEVLRDLAGPCDVGIERVGEGE